jgi:hypothetical protein
MHHKRVTFLLLIAFVDTDSYATIKICAADYLTSIIYDSVQINMTAGD